MNLIDNKLTVTPKRAEPYGCSRSNVRINWESGEVRKQEDE